MTEDPANSAKYDTEKNNSTPDQNGNPIYTPERIAQHQEIVNQILQDARDRGVPADRHAIMSGGMGGSGKGHVLSQTVDDSQYLTIDPDRIKAEMLRRGMGPDIPGLQPMEAAFFTHEESSRISKLLTAMAAQEGLNTILDTTMATEGSTRKRAQLMKDSGYTLSAIFSDVPLEVTIDSARNRYQKASEEYQKNGGRTLGGRLVPESYLHESAPSEGSLFASKNRETLEHLRNAGWFSDVKVYDNSDRSKFEPPLLYHWVDGQGFVEGEDPQTGLTK